MANRVSSYFPKGGHSATETELKAPILLGCDEFAMGLRIDSPNRRELSRNVRMVSQSPRMHREPSRTVHQSFKHVILFMQKQATENRNKITALERSVMNYWGLN